MLCSAITPTGAAMRGAVKKRFDKNKMGSPRLFIGHAARGYSGCSDVLMGGFIVQIATQA